MHVFPAQPAHATRTELYHAQTCRTICLGTARAALQVISTRNSMAQWTGTAFAQTARDTGSHAYMRGTVRNPAYGALSASNQSPPSTQHRRACDI